MTPKDKIIEILNAHSYNVTDQAGNRLNVIDDGSFEEIAGQIEPSSLNSEEITEAAMEYAEIDGTIEDYDESMRDAAHFVAGAVWYHKRIKGNGY